MGKLEISRLRIGETSATLKMNIAGCYDVNSDVMSTVSVKEKASIRQHGRFPISFPTSELECAEGF